MGNYSHHAYTPEAGGSHHAGGYPPPDASPNHGAHSYAQQVGYYLQQPVSDFLAPSIQSGGPRTTPSGYPGGPVVPPGHVSPKLVRRGLPPAPYSDNVMRTAAASPHSSPQQGPMTFTRALEVTDQIQMRGGGGGGGRGGPPPLPNNNVGAEAGENNRESLYDVNYEISV